MQPAEDRLLAWEDRPRLSREREERLFAGVNEAARFFMGEADVQRALEKIAHLLEEDGIPYALIGAMALNAYGYRRVTVDVDLLLTREGPRELSGRSTWGSDTSKKFPGSKGLRDTEHGVPIDVVLAGEYPGDGNPKPVVFPDPATAAVRGARVALLPLPRLIELKLASGMTAPHRLKDLADVHRDRPHPEAAGRARRRSSIPTCGRSTGRCGRPRRSKTGNEVAFPPDGAQKRRSPRTPAPAPEGASFWRRNRRELTFLILFVVLLGGGFTLISVNWVNDHVVEPFTAGIARTSGAVLDLLGQNVTMEGTVIRNARVRGQHPQRLQRRRGDADLPRRRARLPRLLEVAPGRASRWASWPSRSSTWCASWPCSSPASTSRGSSTPRTR